MYDKSDGSMICPESKPIPNVPPAHRDLVNMLLPDEWEGFLREPIIVLSNLPIYPIRYRDAEGYFAGLKVKRVLIDSITPSNVEIVDRLVRLMLFAPNVKPLNGGERSHTVFISRTRAPSIPLPIPTLPTIHMYYIVPVSHKKYATYGNVKDLENLKLRLQRGEDVYVGMIMDLGKGTISHTIPIFSERLMKEFRRQLRQLYTMLATQPIYLEPIRGHGRYNAWKKKTVRDGIGFAIRKGQMHLLSGPRILFTNQVYHVGENSVSLFVSVNEEIKGHYLKRYTIRTEPVYDLPYMDEIAGLEFVSRHFFPTQARAECELDIVLTTYKSLDDLTMRLLSNTGIHVEISGTYLKERILLTLDALIEANARFRM